MTAMTAPLALYLTRFSAPPLAALDPVEIVVPPPEPTVTLLETELDARLAHAADIARSECEARHAAEIESFVAAHEAALVEAVAAARAEWVEVAGDRFAALIETQVSALRDMIDDRLALVLRPLLTDAARSRTMQALTDALDRLLADPGNPAIRISGPQDLLNVLREARPTTSVEWIAADQADVTITAGSTRIDAKLATALDGIGATEGCHGR